MKAVDRSSSYIGRENDSFWLSAGLFSDEASKDM